MIKIISYIKKRSIILVVFLIVASTLVFISNKKQSVPTTSPTPFSITKIAIFNSIQPGQTSLDKVNELLGKPIKTEDLDGKTIVEYKSTNKFRTHLVEIQNGTAVFIKQVVNSIDGINASDIRKEFGIEKYILYEKKENSTFNLFVYPENGIAYFGHNDGTILEIWYFLPTDIDTFLKSWAVDFQKEEYKTELNY